MRHTGWIESPVGPLRLAETDGALTAVAFEETMGPPPTSPLLLETARQLRAYFAGTLREFSLPLAPGGTAFQQRVWQALTQIPYGETCTYGHLAAAIGNPRACRAVGMANHRNPLVIVIPCHRVVGADGSLTGYGGGLARKQWLLAWEDRVLKGCIFPQDAL